MHKFCKGILNCYKICLNFYIFFLHFLLILGQKSKNVVKNILRGYITFSQNFAKFVQIFLKFLHISLHFLLILGQKSRNLVKREKWYFFRFLHGNKGGGVYYGPPCDNFFIELKIFSPPHRRR